MGGGTIGISDQAGIQAGEKKMGIPVPRGGLRRGRSTELLSGRGSLDERRLPSPIPEFPGAGTAGGIPDTLG